MSDFAAFRRTDTTHFAGGIRWEVIVQHEAVGVFAAQRIDDLLVARCAECGHGKSLRFAACEQRGTVCARQHIGLDIDGAHGARVAAVNARLAGQNLTANHVGFQLFEDAFDFVFRQRVGFFGNQRSFHSGPCFVQFGGTRLFLADFEGFGNQAAGNVFHFRHQFGIGFWRFPVPHFRIDFIGQFVNGLNHRLHLLVAVHHRAQHHVFGQDIGFGFHHQNGLCRTGHHQIQF